MLIVVDEAQTLLRWERTHYAPLSEMSPIKGEESASSASSSSPTQPASEPSPAPVQSATDLPPSTPKKVSSPSSSSSSSTRSLFSLLLRCLNSYGRFLELPSCISGSSLTLLGRSDSYNGVAKNLPEWAIEGPPLRSVREQVQYIKSVLRDLPAPVVHELEQLILLRGRCRFAAFLVAMVLTEPMLTTDLLEHVRYCAALLPARVELEKKIAEGVKRYPALFDACTHLYMAYLWNEGFTLFPKFRDRVIELLKWGLVPLDKLRVGAPEHVVLRVTEPLLIGALEAVLPKLTEAPPLNE